MLCAACSGENRSKSFRTCSEKDVTVCKSWPAVNATLQLTGQRWSGSLERGRGGQRTCRHLDLVTQYRASAKLTLSQWPAGSCTVESDGSAKGARFLSPLETIMRSSIG
eukprot:965736-Amphidinium_carterae.1